MGERQFFPLTFGEGLDRATGTMAVEPASFADLRNVHLHKGKAELRAGLLTSLLFGGDDAVLAIHPIHSQGIAAAVTYDSVSRDVHLYLMANDGSVNALVGAVWTLPVGVAYPRVIVDDSYDKLFIAHDEEFFDNRQQTMVYDPTAGTLAALMADFDRSGVSAPVRFRGVRKHLAYMTGWGYGSEAALQGDRPEIVRVSLPADPVTFLPEHYFIAGQRNEPVLACNPAGDVLAVRKADQSFKITGYSRTNFGIEPLDTEYGCIAGRLSITVNGRNYFWSLEGPRASDGGASTDIALPLDVTGDEPDPKASEIDPAYGFAVYVPGKREVWFVFGKWVYALSLADDHGKWSYNETDVELISGGVLYSKETASLGTLAYPFFQFGSAGYSPGVDPDASQLTIGFATSGDLVGDEHAEVWVRPRYGATGWYKLGEVFPVLPTGNALTLPVTLLGVMYDVAIRYREAGLYAPAYSTASPSLWPAASRGTVTSRIPHIDLDLVGHAYRTDATHWALPFTMHVTGFAGVRPNIATHPELSHKLEYSSDYVAGPWTLATDEAYDGTIQRNSVDPIPGDTKAYRYTLYTAWDYEDFNSGAVGIVFRQAKPTNVALVTHVGDVTVNWVNEFVGPNATSVDVVVLRSTNGGAYAEISRVTKLPGDVFPVSYVDAAATHGTNVQYKVNYETLAFAVTDIDGSVSPVVAYA